MMDNREAKEFFLEQIMDIFSEAKEFFLERIMDIFSVPAAVELLRSPVIIEDIFKQDVAKGVAANIDFPVAMQFIFLAVFSLIVFLLTMQIYIAIYFLKTFFVEKDFEYAIRKAYFFELYTTKKIIFPWIVICIAKVLPAFEYYIKKEMITVHVPEEELKNLTRNIIVITLLFTLLFTLISYIYVIGLPFWFRC